jgi:Cys-rich protein (TIGR01571 family)
LETQQQSDIQNNEHHLSTSMLPSFSAPVETTVDVIAPSSLREGYTFDAVHQGQVFTVRVPKGGVKAGQTFSVPFVPIVDDDDEDIIIYAQAVPVPSEATPIVVTTSTTTTTAATRGTPSDSGGTLLGQWKDGLCDCCAPGCCHPSLCNAICFPQILMGQVLTRMQLTWCADRARSQAQYKWTFHMLLWLTASYWLVWFFFHCDEEGDHGHGPNCHGWRHHVLGVTKCVWFLYTLIVMTKLRKAVRNKYKIPQTTCQGCEDCCCVFFCSCCTIAQLARQTADYERQRAYCCTETGLAEARNVTPEDTLVV